MNTQQSISIKRRTLNPQAFDCVICHKDIQGKYVYDNWGNKAHASHSLKLCSSCNRIISQRSSKGGVQHPDGRSICMNCYQKSVKTDKQVQEAYEYIIDIFKQFGFTGLPHQIPICLVDKIEMKKLSGSSDSLGLVKIIKSVNGYSNPIISQTIYILNYLPKTYFKGVLAHELLHAWLAHQKIHLGQYEEAFCNIGSTLIYNLNKDQYLSHYLNEKMKVNKDPDYGIRFMELKNKLKQLGWKMFIEEIQKFK